MDPDTISQTSRNSESEDSFTVDLDSSDEEQDDSGNERTVTSSFVYHDVDISVVKGNIEQEEVDVIVNSTSKELDLNSGRASRILLQQAGDEIQNECKEKYPNGIQEGELAISGPGNLSCKYIYHGCLKKFSALGAEKIHMDFVRKILDEANEEEMTSIAIPGLGTGFLGFPKDKAARNIQDAVKAFIDENPDSSISDIRFVIHQEDQVVLKAFQTILEIWKNNESAKAVCRDVLCVNRKGVQVKLKVGRLQDEKVEVIVNSTDSKLVMNQGVLSRDLSQSAGKAVQGELKKNYQKGIKNGDIAISGGGNIPCKKIYHACCGHFNESDHGASEKVIVDIVFKCLKTAEENRMTSVAFPALGTKNNKYPSKVSASAVFKGIQKYIEEHSVKIVTDIRVLVYGTEHEEIVEAYEEEMNTLLGASGVARSGGTAEFCMEMYSKELRPPSYWEYYTCDKSVKEWKSEKQKSGYFRLLDVGDSVKTAVTNLITQTWQPDKIGHGRDAAGLSNLRYNKLEVTDVKRLENIDLFENYAHMRSRLFHKAGDIGVFEQLQDISGSKGEINTMANIDDKNVLRQELYREINEHFLFHGTKPDTYEHILAQGLDFRMAGEKGMFGQGIYLAESSTKADQYTDPKFKRDKGEKMLFLVRTCLGKICLLKSHNNVLHRPPCFVKGCESDSCQHEEIDRCDSVIGDGTWLFREFVIYSQYQMYPEYLVTYKRK